MTNASPVRGRITPDIVRKIFGPCFGSSRSIAIIDGDGKFVMQKEVFIDKRLEDV